MTIYHDFVRDSFRSLNNAQDYTERRREAINYLHNIRNTEGIKTELEYLINDLIEDESCPFCETNECLKFDAILLDGQMITLVVCPDCGFEHEYGEPYHLSDNLTLPV